MKVSSVAIAVLLSFTTGMFVQAASLSPPEQEALAQRFRPYIKTTLDGQNEEPHHPCNWQWFIGHSTLVSEYVSYQDPNCPIVGGVNDVWPDGFPVLTADAMAANPASLIEQGCADMRKCSTNYRFALHLDTIQDPGGVSYRGGESWDDVVHNAHGIYAHVEAVPDTNMVNIEYTIVWPYNTALCNFHNGDLTTLVLVYDRDSDLLTRVTYSIHGTVVDIFRIAEPDTMSLVLLPGLEQDNNTVLYEKALACQLVKPNEWQDGPWYHSPSVPTVYLTMDPVTQIYEHPVVFAEHGSHEFWPNPSGSVLGAPAHDGNGFSFLPDKVQILGELGFNDENQIHIPFLYYSGKFGTDPQAIALHNTWYWPRGRGTLYDAHGVVLNVVDSSRFTDRDPYIQNGPFAWPPPVEFSNGPGIVYVKRGSLDIPFDGSQSAPFPELLSAMSLVPARGTVSVAAGGYPGHYRFSRACRVVAAGGAVRVGAP